MTSQVQNGHALEYLNAIALHSKTSVELDENYGYHTAFSSFKALESSQDVNTLVNMRKSADVASDFLIDREPKILNGRCIRIQTAQVAKKGDVRDIIVIDHNNNDVGISVKHNHSAVKHWRLPKDMDFGKSWINVPVSQTYLAAVKPIYEFLRAELVKGTLWNQKEVPKEEIYDKTLSAFEEELPDLLAGNAAKFVEKMLGTHSFYKVMCNLQNTKIVSFNFDGCLFWGDQLKFPTQLVKVFRAKNKTTTNVVFDEGWQISFRLHNGDKEIKPSSLKFDVQLVGMPVPSTIELDHK